MCAFCKFIVNHTVKPSFSLVELEGGCVVVLSAVQNRAFATYKTDHYQLSIINYQYEVINPNTGLLTNFTINHDPSK